MQDEEDDVSPTSPGEETPDDVASSWAGSSVVSTLGRPASIAAPPSKAGSWVGVDEAEVESVGSALRVSSGGRLAQEGPGSAA